MATFAPRDEAKNGMKVCPINPTHRLSGRRYQKHVSECRAKHAESQRGLGLEVCPFNSTHIMGPGEREKHLSRCPDAGVAIREAVDTTRRVAETGTRFLYPGPKNSSNDQSGTDPWLEEAKRFGNEPLPKALNALADRQSVVDMVYEEGSSTIPFLDPISLGRLSKTQRDEYHQMVLQGQRTLTGGPRPPTPPPPPKKYPSLDKFRVPSFKPHFKGLGRGSGPPQEPGHPGPGQGRGSVNLI